jgi:hypothetical protein
VTVAKVTKDPLAAGLPARMLPVGKNGEQRTG